MRPIYAVLAGLGLAAYSQRAGLKHFSPSEFGPWYTSMNRVLLANLDAFRELWGAPVMISPAAGGIGRHLGPENTSQHNIDRWGDVRAIDVFPKVPDGAGGFRWMATAIDRNRALDVARRAGFTGIGIYTDTRPGNMLHLDMRGGDRVATWSRVSGDYLGINEVLV